MTPITLLVPPSSERFDGVRDFARQLAEALRPGPATLVTTRGDAAPPEGARILGDWRALDVMPPGSIIVNYLPTAWLGLETPALLGLLRRFRSRGGRVIVVIHEYQIDSDGSLRRHAARMAFRQLAAAFARRADALVATHGLVVRRLQADGLDRLVRVVTIPIGSGIAMDDVVPQAEGARGSAVVLFGQPAFMDAPAVKAVADAVSAGGGAPLRWMCRDARELEVWLDRAGVARDRVTVLAGLAAPDVSRELAAAALAFAPIADGVSTRRSSVAAFVQHGLPVAGIGAEATDAVLEESGAFALVRRGDSDGMVARVRGLLAAPADRRAMSAAARRLFLDHLAWPRIAGQYRELMN